MKKRIFVCLCLVAMFATGCGNKVECELCGEEKAGETRTVFGEKTDVCDDCWDALEGITSGL